MMDRTLVTATRMRVLTPCLTTLVDLHCNLSPMKIRILSVPNFDMHD